MCKCFYSMTVAPSMYHNSILKSHILNSIYRHKWNISSQSPFFSKYWCEFWEVCMIVFLAELILVIRFSDVVFFARFFCDCLFFIFLFACWRKEENESGSASKRSWDFLSKLLAYNSYLNVPYHIVCSSNIDLILDYYDRFLFWIEFMIVFISSMCALRAKGRNGLIFIFCDYKVVGCKVIILLWRYEKRGAVVDAQKDPVPAKRAKWEY